jgi:S-DNA-T family DNA segregation ATPase FtsK/SpoIIIE
MRIALTALTPHGPRDLIVSADDGATVADVAAAAREALAWPGGAAGAARLAPVISLPLAGPAPEAAPGPAPGGQPDAPSGMGQETLWVDGRQADPRAPAVRALPDGGVVAMDPRAAAATRLSEPSGVIEVRAVGGLSAGTVHRLGPGAVTLGAAPECHIRLPGPGVPGYAAQIVITPADGSVTAMIEPPYEPEPGEGPAPRLDGEPVTVPGPWPPGSLLTIGPHVLALHRPEAPDAHLSPADGGGLAYNRPPRLLPSDRPRRIEVPAEPKRAERARLQLLAALVPLALGLVMAKVLHQWMYALFMLLGPVMIVSQWMSDRRHGRVSHKKAMKTYRERWAELEGRIAAERAAEEAELRDAAPDPAQILLTATGPRRRLWERRASDPDLLDLRVGLADQPSRVEFRLEKKGGSDGDVPQAPADRDVPVSLPMPQLGVVGLAGPRDASRALARWLVAQAATLHSPRDVSIVVLSTDPQAAAHWNWVRWLPHSVPTHGEDCVALVGADPEAARRRVAELSARAAERIKIAGDSGHGLATAAGAVIGPKVLVVLDGARTLRRIPGMPQVLAASRAAGIYAICIDDSERALPEECAAVLSWDRDRPGWVTMRGSGLDLIGGALADQVSIAWVDRLARALAPVRDVSRDDDGAAVIPAAARLLDVIGLPDPAPDAIAAVWQRLGSSTVAPVGVGADGVFAVDLRADGPHGLVAGTTGSGKSELLQTLIASLATLNRPDAMTFVLIDYKGGSAFKDCARLPHTVGMVSDLDGHLTERALASLSAELKRREEILLYAGAKDIEDYWDARRSDPGLEPLPRLVLIIDEFASLVAELPDFVTGLVGIAQRGRSLGVHLILATQRPAGVVSADIRANTNLRIALRVTDADESADVIDTRDAAFISKATPGRCYVRSGAGSPVAVQSARVGGRRPGSGPAEAPARVIPVSWTDLGRPLPFTGAAVPGDDGTMATDLSVLVDAIAGAATRLGLPSQRSPWLPPLPELVTVGELAAGPAPGAPGEIPPIPYGLTDVPARQSREPLALDLAHGGHVVIAGGARSGRSTTLRTIAGSVAAHASPADVHIYAIDCGTGAMLPLSWLPHCGAVVSRDQTDRIERLLGKLRAEISRRQQLLAAGGFAGLAEQRASAPPGEKLPWMVLLLDWWEGFFAAFEHYDYGRLIDTLLQTLREGGAVGMRAVVTTDRLAMTGQTGTVFGRRMLLRLADPVDAGLAGLSERSLPRHQPAGRVMFEGTPNPFEAQVAMLDRDASGPAQVAALRRLGEQSAARFGPPGRAQRPLRVDALPARITVAETWKLDPDFTPPSPLWALVGAGGDELGPQGLDVRDEGPGLVVAGPPRSGRSTTLLTMATSLLASGTPIVVITPRRSPLRSLDGRDGVLAVLGDGAAADELTTTIGDRERYVVLADDAELLFNGALEQPLEKILRSGRDGDHGVILAGSTGDLGRAYSGFIPSALKSRCGVLVAVTAPGDGDLFGVRLPRNAGSGAAGRGLLVRPGVITPVQLALGD